MNFGSSSPTSCTRAREEVSGGSPLTEDGKSGQGPWMGKASLHDTELVDPSSPEQFFDDAFYTAGGVQWASRTSRPDCSHAAKESTSYTVEQLADSMPSRTREHASYKCIVFVCRVSTTVCRGAGSTAPGSTVRQPSSQ